MKCYQIWMKVWKEDDEDWVSSSGHYENMPYSNTIYTSEAEAKKVMEGIDKRHAYYSGGLSGSYCEKLYVKELTLEVPECMHKTK